MSKKPQSVVNSMSSHSTPSFHGDVTPSPLPTCCREDTSPSSSDSYSPRIPSSIPVNCFMDSHHAFSRTMDLSSDKQDSSHPSLIRSVNDDLKSNLPLIALPSSMDMTSNHCILPKSSISSACEDVSADPSAHRSESLVGVKSISCGDLHSLLLTYSGEFYGWGNNVGSQVLYDGPESIKSPIKTAFNDIQAISAGVNHSFALSSDGKLYGWGINRLNQINRSSSHKLPITEINIPYEIKEVYGSAVSFALTQEGQVVKWGDDKSFELIKGLNNIVSMSVYCVDFVAVDLNGDFFFSDRHQLCRIPVTQRISTKEPSQGSFLLVGNYLFVIDVNGDVWMFSKNNLFGPFCDKPTKVPGLTNIVFINGCNGIYAAIDNSGKVSVWGQLSRISDLHEDSDEPKCIEAFTNIEGISVGQNFLFAYNKNTVWAWGRNYKGQLGTGDLIDRPHPVKVFGSEILGSFRHPRQPLGRVFSGPAKLIYFEYLQYLKNLFGNCRYPKARFYTKCGISKKVAKISKKVINRFEFLKDTENLNLNENICELQLRLSTGYQCPKVINSRIEKLEIHYDEVDYDPELLTFFPNVEEIKLSTLLVFRWISLNLAHLSNLKCLELHYPFNIEQLPASLVKLVLTRDDMDVTDFSYLASLKELVVMSYRLSPSILEGQIHLPQSIVRLEVLCQTPNIYIQLKSLKELVIIDKVPAKITEQNFPSLKFIQFIKSIEFSLSSSPLSPRPFINQGLFKSVKLIKNEFLVELSCFPWWIQYPAKRSLFDIFHGYLDESLESFQ
ncbi:hypothetical protein P9112_010156 [Eukaryota sp. TZLM1-RC]